MLNAWLRRFWVWCLAAVWQFQAEHSRQSVSGFGRHLGVQVAGQSGAFIGVFYSCSVLVPSAMDEAGATYQEWHSAWVPQ